ncbi:hypothetical protein NL676_007025 [Syzygium grande]|nr:hypothetical protein NL676_007025 [Syzygium grande]
MHSTLGYDPNTQEHVILKIWVHFNPKDREEQHYVGTELIELGGHVVLSELKAGENGNEVPISLYVQ